MNDRSNYLYWGKYRCYEFSVVIHLTVSNSFNTFTRLIKEENELGGVLSASFHAPPPSFPPFYQIFKLFLGIDRSMKFCNIFGAIRGNNSTSPFQSFDLELTMWPLGSPSWFYINPLGSMNTQIFTIHEMDVNLPKYEHFIHIPVN